MKIKPANENKNYFKVPAHVTSCELQLQPRFSSQSKGR